MPELPNILFLFPDQLRRDFLSCYGAAFIDTPNIDRIAAQGVRYDCAYSASPLCVPARTSLMTGMNAVRNGVADNLHALRPDYNEAGIQTWPQILSDVGYYTSAVGKMHFYPWDALHGFQYRVVCEDKLWTNIRDDYHHYLTEHGRKKMPWDQYGDYLEKKGAATTDVPWEHSWDRFTGREACRFIDNYGGDGPFAMMVGFPGPHDPYDPAVDFSERFNPEDMPDPVPASDDDPGSLRAIHIEARRNMGMDLEEFTVEEKKTIRAHYAGLVKQIDHEVGEIIDSLNKRGLLENTVIIFSTDHGDYLGDHGLDGKAAFFEAATHIPLLVSLPGDLQGSVNSDLVELRDITATILKIAGCDQPKYMDAQILPGLGLQAPSARTRIFGMLTQGWMVFDGQWKLCQYSLGGPMLFNLKEDPEELNNLIKDPDYSDVFRRLSAELAQEMMESIVLSNHDRLVAPYSLSSEDKMGREGWQWKFPADASEATKVGVDYY